MMEIKIVIFLVAISGILGQECIPDAERVDCHPDEHASEAACLSRGCVWCQGELGTPWCFLPPTHGYVMDGEPEDTGNGYRVTLNKFGDSSYFGDDSETIFADFIFDSDYRLHIKITDGTPRFEVPVRIYEPASGPVDPLYSIEFSNNPVFSFKVVRKSTGTAVFDTSLGGLTFSNQFLQIGIRTPSTYGYGVGENAQATHRHNFSRFDTFPLWTRDQAPIGHLNSYGVQPYYTVVENDGNTHSVAFMNSNAQEIVVSPAPGYIYRTIGGILDIYLFMGPTPENTAQQYSEAIGRQFIPPYWGLGFILSRWGYDSIENMQAAVNRTAQYNIPQDVQVGDIDIMDRALDFTYDTERFAGLPEYIQELKGKGIKFVTILDPGISFNEPPGTYPTFDEGNAASVWMTRSDGSTAVGNCWPGDVYFPDWSKNSTKTWWSNQIRDFKDLLAWDGLWIDMNEPANFGNGDIVEGCEANSLNNPPYVPGIVGRSLWEYTMCPDHVHEFGSHYDTHSLYGYSMSVASFEAMQNTLGDKRGFVLTRSQFPGTGQYAAHWLGDNFSEWPEIGLSIIGLLNYNLFGMPYAGSDICGFIFNSTLELCQRWQQVGAFYPFSRNHNIRDTIDQDPGNWGPESAESTRKAYEVRYTLLPYLYSLFYKHRLEGNTVVRALWHQYPTDTTALNIDRQFLWGSGLLISPVIDEGAVTVDAYFPVDRWYSYYDGLEVPVTGQTITLDAPMDFIPVHVHGGDILPTQEPDINTELSRQHPFGLIVALDSSNRATGELYYDDGEIAEPQDKGLYYHAAYVYVEGSAEASLSQNILLNNYDQMNSMNMDTVRIFGMNRAVNSVQINLPGSSVGHDDWESLPSGELRLNNLNIPMGDRATIVLRFV